MFDSLFTLRKQPSPPPPRISQAQFVIRGSIDVNKQSHPGCIIDQLFCVVPWVVVIPRLSVRLRQLLHTEPHRHESEGDSDNAAHKSDRERARRHAANRPMAPLAGRAGPPSPTGSIVESAKTVAFVRFSYVLARGSTGRLEGLC